MLASVVILPGSLELWGICLSRRTVFRKETPPRGADMGLTGRLKNRSTPVRALSKLAPIPAGSGRGGPQSRAMPWQYKDEERVEVAHG